MGVTALRLALLMEALLSWTRRLPRNWGRAGVQPRSLNLQERTCTPHPLAPCCYR